MSVPKRRKTSSRTRKGRSHDALSKVGLTNCPKCKQPRRPHTACANCGTYKSRAVVTTRDAKKAAQQEKKERKIKEAQKKA
jgi:large subunit ribosomal protein L32